jgi:hypothetical protein
MRDPNTERKELDSLLEEARLYTSTRAFMELLNFVITLPHIAPFNAMLLQIQKRGLSYVATRFQWWALFRRVPKEGARPLVVLKAFGPVDFVYDILDTEGPPLPDGVQSFFARGPITAATMRQFEVRLLKAHIDLLWMDEGDRSAGSIRQAGALRTKEGSFNYQILLNGNHAPPVQFATLAHELGHLCLSHLGPDKDLGIAERPRISDDLRELEAESVSYLVCKRNEVETSSASYLAEYVRSNSNIGHLDVYQVLKAAGHVERLLGLGGLKEEKPSNETTTQGSFL